VACQLVKWLINMSSMVAGKMVRVIITIDGCVFMTIRCHYDFAGVTLSECLSEKMVIWMIVVFYK
jgi:hypothetical protein